MSVASRRGYRVDVPAVMGARRANPADFMHRQFTENLRRGRVHPRFHATGTVTGRMTSELPNLQGMSTTYRRALLAEDGMSLVGADISRFEPTVAAALSRDQALIGATRGDLYLELASRVTGETVGADDPRRKIFKTALIAVLYGEGVELLARGVTGRDAVTPTDIAYAREVRQSIYDAYPAFASWVAGLVQGAKNGEPIRTAGGRVIAALGADERGGVAAYKAVNYMVQGSAADRFKRDLVRIDARLTALGMPGSLWLPVHDEITVQVPADGAEEAAANLRDVLTAPFRGVPLVAEPVVFGARYGKA